MENREISNTPKKQNYSTEIFIIHIIFVLIETNVASRN